MEKLNNTPEEIAQSVRKTQVSTMETYPLLASFKGRIGRSQFLKWYIPLWITPLLTSYFDVHIAGVLFLIILWPLFALTTKRCMTMEVQAGLAYGSYYPV